MVDSNKHREVILPSEKAFSYKMKLDALKRKAGRPCNNSTQLEPNLKGIRSNEQLAERSEEGRAQIQRYIRLTNLIPELLQIVDEKSIALNPAVELSYLSESEQATVLEATKVYQCTPSFSQAVRLKKLSKTKKLTEQIIFDMLAENKANQKERISFQIEELQCYFSKSYSEAKMKAYILNLLQKYPPE